MTRHRHVGQRFYNKEIDESFTVVDYDGLFAILQYDDGVGWDEAIDADSGFGTEMRDPETGEPVHEEGWTIADQVGVSEEGLDDEMFLHLGAGPTIPMANELCDEDGHEWYPKPSDLGWSLPEQWHSSTDGNAPTDIYNRVARCRRCGLSPSTLLGYTSHDTPSVCMECGTDLMPGEDEYDWLGDHRYCEPCGEELRQEERTCAVCDDTLPRFREDGELNFRTIGPGWYEQHHDKFDVDFSEPRAICHDCFMETVNP